jgi:ABC-type transporter MlaC component
VPAVEAESPLETTKRTLQQMREVVDGPGSHNDKLAALERLLANFLETDGMGRAALDVHWSKFAPAQRREFLSLFRTLFERSYVEKLLLFDRPDFAFRGETRSGQTAEVHTAIITPKDEFNVTYRLREVDHRWMATDIQIEDLSLTSNFKHQFDRLLETSSPAEVLARLRKKLGAAS